MEYLLIGVCVFFNIAIIKWKFTRGQRRNAGLEALLLAGVMIVFHGSFGALVVGTIGSALLSLYLIVSPFKEAK